jgi:hypothetical protein
MYVAKFTRSGLLWEVTLFEKRWSETMLSHEIEMVNKRRFIFHSSGYRWVNKEVAKILFRQHKLEIIDG